MPERPSPDDHDSDAADAADVGVREEGAHDPIVGDEANLDPGERGDERDAPEHVGGDEDDGGEQQRRALVEEVRDDD